MVIVIFYLWERSENPNGKNEIRGRWDPLRDPATFTIFMNFIGNSSPLKRVHVSTWSTPYPQGQHDLLGDQNTC